MIDKIRSNEKTLKHRQYRPYILFLENTQIQFGEQTSSFMESIRLFRSLHLQNFFMINIFRESTAK